MGLFCVHNRPLLPYEWVSFAYIIGLFLDVAPEEGLQQCLRRCIRYAGVSKEAYYVRKRDLFIWQKRPLKTHTYLLRYAQVSKEPYLYGQ